MKISLVLLPNWPRKMPSLAIAYLASHLIKQGHTVCRFEFNLTFRNREWMRFIDNINMFDSINFVNKILNNPLELHKERLTKLESYIQYCASTIVKKNPIVVGFSISSPNTNFSLLVARKIRELNKDIILIFGGPNVLEIGEPGQIFLTSGLVDYLIFGEGERVLPQLLKELSESRKIKVPGVIFLHEGKVISTGEWVPEKNLDTFEFPLFQEEDIKNSLESDSLPVALSRGCIWNCNFCNIGHFWKRFRQRTPDNILDEIKYHIKTWNIRCFKFADSLINVNMKFLEDFCKLVVKENIHFEWRVSIRADKRLTDSMLHFMYQAGCRILHFGAESASNDILKEMDKQNTIEILQQNLIDCHNNNIQVHLNFISGYPGETEENFLETVNFIVRNKTYIYSFSVNPFYLSKNADVYKKKGIRFVDDSGNKRLRYIERIFKHDPLFAEDLLFENRIQFIKRSNPSQQKNTLVNVIPSFPNSFGGM